MAKKSDLAGLGLSWKLADVLATEPNVLATFAGASYASGYQLGGSQQLMTVEGTGSCYINLPPVGGNVGCYLGDDVLINNQAGTSIIITASGATTTLNVGGANISAQTGISIQQHNSIQFYAITATSWLGVGYLTALPSVLVLASVTAATAASAATSNLIGLNNNTVVVQGTGSGFLALPLIGAGGIPLNDQVTISNQAGASIIIVSNTTTQTLNISTGSVTGTTGVSVSAGVTIEFIPVSTSTWIGFKNV